MVKKPRSQHLRERVEKSTVSDSLDSDWQSHLLKVSKDLNGIGLAAPPNILTQKNASDSVKYWSAQISFLAQLNKQVKAVSSVLNEAKYSSFSQEEEFSEIDSKLKTKRETEN